MIKRPSTSNSDTTSKRGVGSSELKDAILHGEQDVVDAVRIEDLVEETLESKHKQLDILGKERMKDALSEFINNKFTGAIANAVDQSLEASLSLLHKSDGDMEKELILEMVRKMNGDNGMTKKRLPTATTVTAKTSSPILSENEDADDVRPAIKKRATKKTAKAPAKRTSNRKSKVSKYEYVDSDEDDELDLNDDSEAEHEEQEPKKKKKTPTRTKKPTVSKVPKTASTPATPSKRGLPSWLG
jgi:hypothetical protein